MPTFLITFSFTEKSLKYLKLQKNDVTDTDHQILGPKINYKNKDQVKVSDGDQDIFTIRGKDENEFKNNIYAKYALNSIFIIMFISKSR